MQYLYYSNVGIVSFVGMDVISESVTELLSIDNGWISRDSSWGRGDNGWGKRFHRRWSVPGHLVACDGSVDRVSRHHLSVYRLLWVTPESSRAPTIRIRWWRRRTTSLYHDLHCEAGIAATRQWHRQIDICQSIKQNISGNTKHEHAWRRSTGLGSVYLNQTTGLFKSE